MELNNKKVLVTGSDGFIGSHLTEELLELGSKVKAFTYYNSFGHHGWLDSLDSSKKKEIEFFSGDIRDSRAVYEAMRDCDVVFHLAALIGIPYSYVAPDSYVDTNIKGTMNVLNAARDLQLERVIATSTSETYGSAQFVPINEKHPLVGQSPYAATKIGADQLALSYHKSFELPVAVARPFNTYGPRQSSRAIIPTIITQIASGAEQIKLGSLSPTRDFTYCRDTATGMMAIACSDESIGKTLNIGMNHEISIGDLVHLISKLMLKNIDVVGDELRVRPENSEVNRLIADNSLIRELTDWKPTFDLEKGLTSTIEWFKEPDNLKRYNFEEYKI